MEKTVAIELKNVTKVFGSIVANKNVDLTLYKGEILAILGENGSGKTTLMNMISGIYYPDAGHIFVDGKEVVIRSPKDAFDLKIGMIHQHFKLINVFSAAENIALGIEEKGYKISKVRAKVEEISSRYGFNINPKKRICDMSVSEKQTVEIVKVLYRGADILILDEPTAVLTPQETDKLFAVLRKMRDDGKAIIIITHKMHEVMAISDRVAVLRKGQYVGSVETASATESQLTEMMVGKKVDLNIERRPVKNAKERLKISGVSFKNHDGVCVLDDVSFSVRSGEIFGIAGIAGSGQRELLETIAGLIKPNAGDIVYNDPKTGEKVDLRNKTPMQIRELGVRLSFVPEDRLGMGLVGSMDIVDNMMLRSYRKGRVFLDRKKPQHLADDIIKELEVMTPSSHTQVRKLSGGNIQKVLVGREISTAPTVLMTAYPVRGLDVNSSFMIYDLLNRQKDLGTAVIFVGEDLDVILDLCDRVMVFCRGRIMGIVDPRKVTKEQIGLMMSGRAVKEEKDGLPLSEIKLDPSERKYQKEAIR